MQKRYYLKKECSAQQYQHNLKCVICQIYKTLSPQILNPTSRILISKYKHQFRNYQISTINYIINKQKHNKKYIHYKEVQRHKQDLQMLISYHKFQHIVGGIKNLILQRSQKDFVFPQHFGGWACKIIMKRILHQKVIKFNQEKHKKIGEKNKGSGITVDQQIKTNPSKHKNIVKFPNILNREGQTPQIRRLTRNISNMVKKFDDNIQFHPSLIFDILDSAPGHIIDITQIQKQKNIKKELINNISVIKQKKQVERLNTQKISEQCRCDIYGLKTRGAAGTSRGVLKGSRECFKKSSTKKSRTKLFKQNVSPNDRIHTDYDCQIIKKQKKKKLSGSSNYKFFTKALSPMVKSSLKSLSPYLKSVSKNKFNKKGKSKGKSDLFY